MRKFSRRKPRVVWLPVFGNNISNEPGDSRDFANGEQVQLAVPGDGTIRFEAFPLTFDASQDPGAQQAAGTSIDTLNDYVNGNAYRLRRLVGKVFVGTNNAVIQETSVQSVDVAAGFIVSRTDSAGVPLTDFENTNPLTANSSDDPWIWRRRWILSNFPEGGSGFQQFPRSNARYGSVADGPHLDQKTARIIAQEERLMFVLAARALEWSAATAATIDCLVDIRILASMRSTQGNRRNASR